MFKIFVCVSMYVECECLYVTCGLMIAQCNTKDKGIMVVKLVSDG